jgi:hypothetical protein
MDTDSDDDRKTPCYQSKNVVKVNTFQCFCTFTIHRDNTLKFNELYDTMKRGGGGY